MPLQMLDIAWPEAGPRAASATGRLDYRWKGNRSGRADLRVRGLSRAGLVLASQADRRRARRGARRRPGGDARGGGQRRQDHRPRPGALRAARPRAAGRRADERAAVRAAALRRAGRHLVAPVGGRDVRPVRARSRSAPTSAAGWSTRQIRGSLTDRRARGSKARSPAWSIDQLRRRGRFSGPRLVLQPDRRARPAAAASIDGQRARSTFSGGSSRARPQLQRAARRCCSTATTSPRAVTGPLRDPLERPTAGRSSGNLRLDSGRFTLGRASAAASVPQLQVRHRGLDADEVIEVAAAAARGGSTWRSPAATSTCAASASTAAGGPTSRSAARPTRRASPAAPTWSAAIMSSPAATSGSSAASSASAAKARPIRCSTSTPRRRSRGSTPASCVSGTGLKPEITFASVPQLPQDELLSRILFGTSITNLSAPEALQLASAVAALQSGSGSLDPINARAPRGRARPAADRPGRRRHRAEDRDVGGQIYRPANCSSR